MLDWAWWFLYHILVAYSVFFVLGIKSVRSLGCLLCSLYSWGRIWSVRSEMTVCRLLDMLSNQCSCYWCLALMHWCQKVVIAWAGELVQLWLFYRSLRVPLLGDLWVLGMKKGKAFLSWYVKVLEFQSSPNWGLGLLRVHSKAQVEGSGVQWSLEFTCSEALKGLRFIRDQA